MPEQLGLAAQSDGLPSTPKAWKGDSKSVSQAQEHETHARTAFLPASCPLLVRTDDSGSGSAHSCLPAILTCTASLGVLPHQKVILLHQM